MSIGITKEQEMVLIVKGLISDLTADQQRHVLALAEHLRCHMKDECDEISTGKLAFALVAAECTSE